MEGILLLPELPGAHQLTFSWWLQFLMTVTSFVYQHVSEVSGLKMSVTQSFPTL